MERDDDRHLRRYAFECRPSRFDVNPVPEVIGARGGKGSKGPTQFPEICRKTGLSERSRVRNKLSPGNASTAFSFSPPFSGRIFKLPSFAANFEYKRRDRA